MSRLAITCGDPDGIGLEVTVKALERWRAPKSVEVTVYASPAQPHLHKRLARIKRPLEIQVRQDSPAHWVEAAAALCRDGHYAALVTAPMSKNPTGHTEILQRVAGVERAFMTFLGKHFHVLLATGHVPVTELAAHVNRQQLHAALKEALAVHGRLRFKKPIGVLALNPHAGEDGKIGSEESWIGKVITGFESRHLVGPLVPDVAFAPGIRKRYSLFVAQYHDQGLIPFKMAHAFSEAAQVTLGLPFLRTSVDHGTAKDIFNQNKADPGSMLAALDWARRLL